ncbi:MAG: hypothetical protein ABFD79_15370 [Phycisphaerales bacterium]
MKNCSIQPILPLDDNQIAQCKKCSSISTNLWCCLYGFWIEGNEINTLLPSNIYERDYYQIKDRYGNLPAFGNHARLDIVDLSKYIQRRSQCKSCNMSNCLIRPCMINEKLIQQSARCIKGKW